MDELFDLIRSEASAHTWSSGVRLVREQAVVLRRQGDGECELSVVDPSIQRPALVNLYPDDEDWSCSCSSTDDVCHHVAASIIAVRHAKDTPLRQADTARRVEYRFFADGESLGLRREITGTQGARERLTQSIKSYRELLLEDGDLEVDALLAGRSEITPPRHLLAQLLHHLEDRTVILGSSRVRLGKPEAGIFAVVEECAEGFRLRLEQSKSVVRIFSNGALLRRNKADATDSLHPIAEHKLPGHILREAERGIIVPRDELADLTSRLIPMFERTLRVERRASAVKRAKRMRPRIAIELRPRGKHSEVLATMVYGEPPVARIDGDRLHMLQGTTPPLRDAAAESALRTRIETELHVVLGQPLPMTASEAVDLGMKLGRTTMPVTGAEKVADLGELEPELEFNGDLRTRFTTQGRSAAGTTVIEAWFNGDDYVPLLEGGFGHLPHGWLARHGHRLADLLAAREVEGKLPAASKAAVAELFEEIGASVPPGLATLIQTLNAQLEAPTDLCATLRSYQRDGVSWLLALKRAKLGGILADDMGLGKTLQAICALDKPSLVVAPTSVMSNWEREIDRFRPTLRVQRYHGANRELSGNADVTVTSYALLRRDIEKLAAIPWSVVVLDEAQAIKNPESQAAQAAMRLKAEFRVTMSGTPVENRLEELWSQMNFANPGLLGSRSYFEKRYAMPIADGNDAARTLLQQRLRPFVRRRLKRDVAPELPPRTDTLIMCHLSHDERAIYDAVRAATKENIVKKLNEGASVMAALEALLRLRQAACDPALLPGQFAESSSKIEALLEALDSALVEGHKALVFSQWTSLLDRVESKLSGRSSSYLRLDGRSRDRQALVDSFQDPDGPSLMLISLKAGGTGLNLTAADHVFLLDPWWNPAAEDQAADRAHRIGQQRPVFVHRLVSRDTVEEKILELQKRKRGLAEAAVGGELAGSPLDRDDILALID